MRFRTRLVSVCLVGVTVFAGTVGAEAVEARPVSRPVDRVVRLRSGAQATLPAVGDKLAVLDAPNGSQLGLTAKTAEVGAVDYATSTTDTGVQTIINIADASAPSTYDFGIDVAGATLVPAANGGVRVQRGIEVVATVAAPWAKDATGRALPTHFELRGSTLRQVVDHAGAQYPVTADPSIGFGWGVYVVFNRQEVRDNLWYANGSWPKLAGLVCVPIASMTGAIGSAFCAAYVAASGANLKNAFDIANETNQCVEIIHNYGSFLPYAWNPINC